MKSKTGDLKHELRRMEDVFLGPSEIGLESMSCCPEAQEEVRSPNPTGFGHREP